MAIHIGHSVSFAPIILILHWVVSTIQFQRKYKLPNVVPGRPLIGNMLDVPYPSGMWGVGMAKKYGEI